MYQTRKAGRHQSQSEYSNAHSQKRSARRKRSGRRDAKASVHSVPGLVFAVCVMCTVVLLVLTLTVSNAHADNRPAGKEYYKSVKIEAGDTMWDIAGREDLTGFSDRTSYIKEVERINGISAANIHAGHYLILPYYA